ncbi:VOC family protein [Paenibacillus sp. GCM10023252]|uniref:VOC family protein n=1 Tax=Paenibacillus sp. GCM10023252 TaxID=3252649 RepID=UPI0036134AFB
MAGKVQRQKITPFLWFHSEAEEAANFYTEIFPNSSIVQVTRYGKERHPIEGIAEGSVMTITFQLDGQEFTVLNGGPQFTLSEAFSLVVTCDSQEEIDYYWEKLSEGGDEKAQVCGWLKDKFGVSWQVVPTTLFELLRDDDTDKANRVARAMLQMTKMDIRKLIEAYEGIE